MKKLNNYIEVLEFINKYSKLYNGNYTYSLTVDGIVETYCKDKEELEITDTYVYDFEDFENMYNECKLKVYGVESISINIER